MEPDPLLAISETLGALNTVGSYIVNMTRGVENSNYPPKELPSAIYTISKNILGTISMTLIFRRDLLSPRLNDKNPLNNLDSLITE